jgi:hypothetical protein
VKIGRIWPNNPESWVEVVELSVMNRSSACAGVKTRTVKMITTNRITMITLVRGLATVTRYAVCNGEISANGACFGRGFVE